MKKFFHEFKEFAMRGNVLDMAIGVVIGAAFGKITTSLVNDIIMPLIGLITGGIDLTQWNIVLNKAAVAAGADPVTLGIGNLLAVILDFIIVLIMASSMDKDCVLSFIPVAVLQGSMTALAVVLSGFMTDAVLNNISLVGNILISCVGINLVWPKTINVANLLPALLVAVGMTGIV